MQGQSTSSQMYSDQAQLGSSVATSQTRRGLLIGLGFILIATVCAALLVQWSLQRRTDELLDGLNKRLELQSVGRSEVISTWLSGQVKQADRVTQSELFRLYAAEIDLIEEDLSLLLTAALTPDNLKISPEAHQLAAQLPMMQNLLNEFTHYAGFISGRVINRSGQSFIATDANTNPLDQTQMQLAKQTLQKNRPQFSAVSQTGNGLSLQIYLPVLPPLAEDGNPAPVAVLQLTKLVSGKINELLVASPLSDKGERIRLLQRSPRGFEELTPWLPGELSKISQPLNLGEANQLPYAERNEINGQKAVLSIGSKVPELDWWVLVEAEKKTALAPLSHFRRITMSLAGMVVLLMGITLGAFWWRMIGVENHNQAVRFRDLAEKIEAQHELLDGINGNLAEYIGLKDNRGLYQYVNPAFANAIGRQPEDIVGLDDVALFGYDTAKRLEASDNLVIEKHQQTTHREQIYLQSKLHHLRISKVPYKDKQGKLKGIISLYRDITELVEEQDRNQRVVRQAIEALVKTIELKDAYLAGHSRLMCGLSRLIAKSMNASDEVIATVETAAYLSQIGKMFIDPQLFNKPTTLSKEEKQQVEQHVEHAANVLREIDFELPIYQAVYQMNEHLDGSGYPQGLKGDEIDLPARILAVTNSFCAMVKPRSYRPARPKQEILEIFTQNASWYDQQVLQTLQEVAQSHEGEKLLNLQ